MPLPEPLPAPPAAVQIAGYTGASFESDIVPEDIVLGARIGRGPVAGVVEGRVGLGVDRHDNLASTLEVLLDDTQGKDSPFASLHDLGAIAVAGELGVPMFGARFSGGPFVQVGIDAAIVRRVTLDVGDDGLLVDARSEDVPVVGGRLSAGASWCLSPNVGVRLQLTDVIRGGALLDVVPADGGATQPDAGALLHQVVVTLTLFAGR